jgi:hypothetical protein
MGKYSTTQAESSVQKPKQTHEVWRAIGCLLMVVIPAISIAIGYETVRLAIENDWGIIPFQLRGYPPLPEIAYKLSGLRLILEPFTKIKNFYAIAVASLLFMILISGLVSVIYAAVYAAIGPSRYGPLDAPPPKIKITKKSR